MGLEEGVGAGADGPPASEERGAEGCSSTSAHDPVSTERPAPRPEDRSRRVSKGTPSQTRGRGECRVVPVVRADREQFSPQEGPQVSWPLPVLFPWSSFPVSSGKSYVKATQVPSLCPRSPRCGQCLVLAVLTSWLARAVMYSTEFTVTGDMQARWTAAG